MHVLRQEVHDALYHDRLPAILAAVIGIMGMTLAAAGLFGVVLHGVNRRQRETGVCMALGARATWWRRSSAGDSCSPDGAPPSARRRRWLQAG